MRVMLRSGAGRVGVALLSDHSRRNELASGSLIHVFPQEGGELNKARKLVFRFVAHFRRSIL
jgi:hypothetical protein